MKVFDVDGLDYPCHAFLPISIGTEKALASQIMDFNSSQDFIDLKCKDCILHSICPTCYGSNYERSGKIAIRDEYLCKLTKIRALANSCLKAKKILTDSTIEKLEGRDYLIVKSALEIQNHIKI
jgi:radical SAM protein with 4Fe4S-binding SPASM domain